MVATNSGDDYEDGEGEEPIQTSQATTTTTTTTTTTVPPTTAVAVAVASPVAAVTTTKKQSIINESTINDYINNFPPNISTNISENVTDLSDRNMKLFTLTKSSQSSMDESKTLEENSELLEIGFYSILCSEMEEGSKYFLLEVTHGDYYFHAWLPQSHIRQGHARYFTMKRSTRGRLIFPSKDALQAYCELKNAQFEIPDIEDSLSYPTKSLFIGPVVSPRRK